MRETCNPTARKMRTPVVKCQVLDTSLEGQGWRVPEARHPN